jgi:hypothetical protein
MFEFLKKIRRARRIQNEDEEWPSIIFFLRERVLPNTDQAIEMAKAAWGAPGPVELVGTVGPHNFVIRVAPLAFALHAVGSRYEVNAGPLWAFQQQCWDEHNAWLSVDLPGKRVDNLRQTGRLPSAYKALRFCAETLVAKLFGALFPW